MHFQHLPELFNHVSSANCFYNSDHFPFQLKSSNMLNLTGITEEQQRVAAFLFWKIFFSCPYDMAVGEHQIRNAIPCWLLALAL